MLSQYHEMSAARGVAEAWSIRMEKLVARRSHPQHVASYHSPNLLAGRRRNSGSMIPLCSCPLLLLAVLRSADWLRKCLLAELAEIAGRHPDIRFGWGCGLSEHREDQRAACERLRHGEWLRDRPDRSRDFKQLEATTRIRA